MQPQECYDLIEATCGSVEQVRWDGKTMIMQGAMNKMLLPGDDVLETAGRAVALGQSASGRNAAEPRERVGAPLDQEKGALIHLPDSGIRLVREKRMSISFCKINLADVLLE